jgi:hypothetical protein
VHRASLVVALAGMCGCERMLGLHEIGGPPDAAVDVPPPEPYLVCPAFEPVLESVPGSGLVEAGLYVDGLRMVVRIQASTALRELRRPAPDEPFGSTLHSTTLVASGSEDAAFVEIGGAVYAFAAVRKPLDTVRGLVVCRDSTCADITVLLAGTDTPITSDLDGVSVALRDGELAMVFNQGNVIYQAEPASADYTVWRATYLEQAGVMADDPALSRDGKLLVVPTSAGLIALRWDPTVATYVTPTPVADAGSAPEFGLESVDGVELFVVLARENSTVPEIHVAVCGRG